MNDKEAIKRLKEVIEDCTSGEDEPYKEAFGMAILALEEKLSGGWIPVSERLPKEVGFYIFQLNDEKIHEYYYANESLYGDCDGDEPIDKMAVNLNDVIAWQPLPFAYKEIENE